MELTLSGQYIYIAIGTTYCHACMIWYSCVVFAATCLAYVFAIVCNKVLYFVISVLHVY